MLTFARKQREATEHLRDDGSEGPHVNGRRVWHAEDDLRRPIKPALNVRVNALAHEARAAVIYQLQSRLILLL